MLQTAEQVAKRYNIGREAMDEYGASSQQKASAALEAGLFKDEIAPITVTMGVADKVMGLMTKQVTVSDDEGIRAGTTYEGIKDLRSALPGGLVSAGNASQLSDGAGAAVVMHEKLAEQKGLKPLGRFLGFAVAGCEPDEMGIGPVFAIPKVLKRLGLTMNDIDLWELNEAFAVQVLYCRDKLGIPADQLNVNGGAIAVGHPYRHERPTPDRPRPHRRQAPWCQAGLRDHVHRRRHGRCWRVRSAVTMHDSFRHAESSRPAHNSQSGFFFYETIVHDTAHHPRFPAARLAGHHRPYAAVSALQTTTAKPLTPCCDTCERIAPREIRAIQPAGGHAGASL